MLVERFEWTLDDVDAVLQPILLTAELVEPVAGILASRDKDDNHVLGCALAGKVDALVSGDRDLLELQSFEGIPILTPRAFLEKLIV